ncbi:MULTISPECIES: hypothetical protein [unclassified Nostoc]|uniref:hypothetical protein n=1 Tax=unclassified Nostoc TaxID=2593658 RepID=UPI002AD23312|nr:hypothetical protein [Nostoc sp. DedQUE03]MDZ7976371.1 hypothetical protein [Nostoc sp. DedQUE03]MDZ8047985.1 hypothetical protein [Nostoc sp. DedQUE02]
MTTIYLHIGMPKTGTSSLQKILFNNRNKLLKNGYLYPMSGIRNNAKEVEDRYCHNLLALFFLDFKEKNDLLSQFSTWEGLKTEIDSINPKNVIISAEAFTFYDVFYKSETIAKVKNLLKDYEIKIVIYFRKQDDFLESCYRYMVNIGASRIGIKDFFNEFKYMFNYYQILENWADIFGYKNIIVRRFDKKNLKNNNFDDFLQAINLLGDKIIFEADDVDKINVSPSVKMTKILLLMNIFNEIVIEKVVNIFYDNYWRRYQDFLRYLRNNKMICNYFSTLPTFLVDDTLISLEEKQKFMEQFEQSNSQLVIKYLGGKDEKLFESTL